MKITSLEIVNFRGIRRFSVKGLKSLVVIAGPNGIGKSTVFDAVRLVKSLYGAYQLNEAQQWFQEFAIDSSGSGAIASLRRGSSHLAMSIEAELIVSETEIGYLHANARPIVEKMVWTQLAGNAADGPRGVLDLVANNPHLVEQAELQIAAGVDHLIGELSKPLRTARVAAPESGGLSLEPDPVLSAIFSTYEPSALGIVDYHGPQRNYARESYYQVSLSSAASKEMMKNSALYNSQQKYSNIKAELLSSYIRGLLADQAGGTRDNYAALDSTMKGLFQRFIPGKTYLGLTPKADGTAEFNVRLEDGVEHDISELSSGERELVFGYLRIQNSTPRHSIILIDEPELHLNPALARNLPDFYFENFAQAMDSQVWLVTHSDAVLRESIRSDSYSVIRMRDAASSSSSNQAVVAREDGYEAALLDLVGDLAAYRPLQRVLVLEGGGKSKFDEYVVRNLFPEIASRVTIVSGGSRANGAAVSDLFSKIGEAEQQQGRLWAVSDRDDAVAVANGVTQLSWDSCHIENYLLVDSILFSLTRAHAETAIAFPTEQSITAGLEKIANEQIKRQVLHRIRMRFNERILAAVKLDGKIEPSKVAEGIANSAQGGSERLRQIADDLVDKNFMEQLEKDVSSALAKEVALEGWRKIAPGKEVLKEFQRIALPGVEYEYFRNSIVQQMKAASIRPAGMADVLQQVVA